MYHDDAHSLACFNIAIYSPTEKKYLTDKKQRFIHTDSENIPILESLYPVVDDALGGWGVEEYSLVWNERPTYYETHRIHYGGKLCSVHVWKA